MKLKFKQKKQFSTKESCLKQIKEDGALIRFVPIHLLTKEMCEIAIKQDSYNLQFIPDRFKNLSLCEMAEKNDSWATLFFPAKMEFKIEDLDLLFV